ncbi:hypothetical protein E2C01_041726 [Portunus trituberculatus]|uniref:Uncharacterized protein n=1 Tax=Portunus trituberculatus TaxID=210409 RepID=A0A5B7FUH6_PORTR|nr:hypothetical protein [Portunus trituberculatus]
MDSDGARRPLETPSIGAWLPRLTKEGVAPSARPCLLLSGASCVALRPSRIPPTSSMAGIAPLSLV